MPYPSEHAARQNPPGKYKKFRRKNGAGGSGVDFIYGITKDGKSEIQTVRFDASKFTVAEAKKWLSDNNMKTGIEAATGKDHSSPSVAQITVPTANTKTTIQYSESDEDEMELESDQLIDVLIENPGISLAELKKGMEHELEHTENKEVAVKIALDHLIEHADYYTKLAELYPIDHAAKPGTEIIMNAPEDDEDEEETDDFSLGIHEDGTICVEAFRAGTHTDAAGETETWSESDIKDIETKGNAQLTEKPVPVVLGHPEADAPAFGWVKKFKQVGDKLRVKLGELNQDFVQALKSGAYKGRSISLYADNHVRHLGFLGGAQPAVAGLQPFKFSEPTQYKTIDFMEDIQMREFDDKDVNFLYRLLNKFGFDIKKTKEHNMAEDTVKKLEAGEGKTEAPATASDPALKEKEVKDPGTEATVKVQTAEAKNEANETAKENSELKGMIQSLMTRIDTLEKAMTKDHSEADATKAKAEDLEKKNKELEAKVAVSAEDEMKNFVEGLVKDGKLRPVDRDMTLMALNAQRELDKVHNMSEGVDPNRKSKYDIYKEHLMAMPKVVEFGEFPKVPNMTVGVSFPAPTDVASTGSYIESKVQAKMAEQDKLGLTSKTSYWDNLKNAMAEVAKEYPEQYREYCKMMMPGSK